MPTSRFSHIHVDLVGPLPSSNGYTYLFTIVDRVSRWPEAIPLASTTADDCATALVQHWISRFGVPDTITSDRGPQFTSALWASLCSRLNITHQPTTAYHPQANGLVERFHRCLKAALRGRCAAADWYHHLPWILLSFRTTPADSSNISPAHQLYGAALRLPTQIRTQPLPDSSSPSSLPLSQPTLHTLPSYPPLPTSIPTPLLHATHVLVRRDAAAPPLTPLYSGPFPVLSRSQRFFTLQVGPRTDTVSVHRLKPAVMTPTTPSAIPPAR